jgi:hypothetical protein
MTKPTKAPQFSKTMREGIELVRSMLTQDFQWPVVTKYGRSGIEPYVEFVVEAIPKDSIATPGPIGVLRRHTTAEGARYEVADAYGATVLDGLKPAQALRLSRHLIGLEGPGFFDGDGRRIAADEAERAEHGLGRDEEDNADGFSKGLRERLDDIRGDISRGIHWPVKVVYGNCDDDPNDQWAAFFIDIEGRCPVALSIFIGKRVEGFAAILGADPRTVLRYVDDEARFGDEADLYHLIYQTVTARFKELTKKGRRPNDDELISMGFGTPLQ